MRSARAPLAAQSQPTTILRVAAAWGMTVLAVKTLRVGESAAFGYGRDALLPQPDGMEVAPIPIRAVDTGWQVDPYGATGGLLRRSARDENPAEISGPIHIMPGDWGLLQYGLLSVFFQFAEAPPPLLQPRRRDWLLRIGLTGSLLFHGAVLVALARVAPSAAPPIPIELLSLHQVSARFGLVSWIDDLASTSNRTSTQPSSTRIGTHPSPPDPSPDHASELKRALFAVASLRSGGPTRGPQTGAPKSCVLSSAGGTVVGGLSMDAAESVAGGHWSALSACCQAEAAARSDMVRTIDLAVRVGADGTVQSAETRGNTGTPAAGLDACMIREIKTWRFPTGGNSSEIRYSFRLSAVGR